jgi:spore coat protein U-like protein
MKRTVLSLIAMATIAAPLFAAQQSANLNVTASVAANCTITTTPVAFGAYDPVNVNSATDLLASGSVNVACTKGTPATIDLGNGGNFAVGTRRMGSGSDFLNYSLFKDAARTQLWGSGIAGGSTAAYNAATKNSTSVSVFGTVPQAQDVTVGNYADVVVATINY